MNIVENISEKKLTDKKKTNLLTVQLKRTLDGSKLFLKSKPFENFFKGNGLGQSDSYIRNHDENKIFAYNWIEIIDKKMNQNLCYFESNLKNYEGILNASFLRAIGLEDGLTVDLQGVYSKSALNEYIYEIKKYATKFYSEYMVNQDMSFTISIVESGTSET